MASFKKRANGTWQATIYVGRDANGKQLFKYVTRDSEKECKRAARIIEQELDNGTFTHIENVHATAWIEKWMDLNKGDLSPSTFALYRIYQKAHFEPFFKALKLKQINDIHIKQFKNDKLKKLSKASVRRMMSVLKRILDEAMKHKSPMKDFKLPQDEKYVPKVPDDKEMGLIHDAVRGTRDEPIILLAAWCGLRRGEIFALKWNDIDWDRGRLRVDEGRSVTEDHTYVDKRPKSENGVREVVIPEYLLNLLDNLRITQGKKSQSINLRIFDMRPDNYTKHFARLIKNKKLPKIRFHDLRHYHASWLYARGVPDQYAAQRLGHDIRVLKKIYQHLGLDRQAEIDSNIRQMFGPKKEQAEAEDAGK